MISKNIQKLQERIPSECDLIKIKCIPEKHAEINDCFPLVEQKVKDEGGKSVFGWQILESKLLVEAIFHAVWKTNEGQLLDISPKPIPMDEILFVPDPKANYEGKQVDNIRINISSNRLIDDLILICEASFRLQNKGDRAYQYALTLKGEDAEMYNIFESAKPMLETMALSGLTHQSQCPCGSGKKYKVCHGKLFRDLAKSI